MRLAFVDLLWSWPPHGGADVDVYHTVSALKSAGHDIHLFFAYCALSWERGRANPDTLPFPATRIDFTENSFTRRNVPEQFKKAVSAWKPDVVIVGDGFALKPYVINALREYHLVSRYYAYETSCQRDILRFRDEKPCPHDYLTTPDVCRRCALEHLGPDIRRWGLLALTHEYVAARAYLPGYRKVLQESLRNSAALVVYNRVQETLLKNASRPVYRIPGGVEVSTFSPIAQKMTQPGDRKIILMPGRVEDPAKGFGVLSKAAERLWQKRQDFVIHVTQTRQPNEPEWLISRGRKDQAGMKQLYAEADICVVPSVWDEPFGLVAVEAMAAGLPVCASRAGGLAETVVEGETGLLVPPGNADMLANALDRLLDDASLRAQMGAAGRKRVEAAYDWKQIVKQHWEPLLKGITG